MQWAKESWPASGAVLDGVKRSWKVNAGKISVGVVEVDDGWVVSLVLTALYLASMIQPGQAQFRKQRRPTTCSQSKAMLRESVGPCHERKVDDLTEEAGEGSTGHV